LNQTVTLIITFGYVIKFI